MVEAACRSSSAWGVRDSSATLRPLLPPVRAAAPPAEALPGLAAQGHVDQQRPDETVLPLEEVPHGRELRLAEHARRVALRLAPALAALPEAALLVHPAGALVERGYVQEQHAH